MSGVEPAAIGAVVARTAGKLTETDPDVKADLIKAAVSHPAFDAAAGSLARRTAVKERIKLQAWRPLGWLFGLNRQYFEEDFHDDLADAMADVPPEEVIPPSPSVAGPSVQGLLFTLDEPVLKQMYIQLLASASDRRSSEDTHPAYAEIIRQLSAEEAQVLRWGLHRSITPIINANVKNIDSDGNVLDSYNLGARHLLDWNADGERVEFPKAPLFIENWVRLGLVGLSYVHHLSSPGQYDWAELRPEVIKLRADYDTESRVRVTIEQGIMTTTDFGKRFAAVAVPKADHTVDADTDAADYGRA